VAFHFLLCASCFHRVRSLAGIKGRKEDEKRSGAGEGAPVVVARHVRTGRREGLYNNAVHICCASLAIVRGGPG